ncbi:unnamed protein product [Caenorhabditis sp. 36 PRJEB53466]|nr:unnamed protein product [Caenorhabditis sp. 36 PRJEB53466]
MNTREVAYRIITELEARRLIREEDDPITAEKKNKIKEFYANKDNPTDAEIEAFSDEHDILFGTIKAFIIMMRTVQRKFDRPNFSTYVMHSRREQEAHTREQERRAELARSKSSESTDDDRPPTLFPEVSTSEQAPTAPLQQDCVDQGRARNHTEETQQVQQKVDDEDEFIDVDDTGPYFQHGNIQPAVQETNSDDELPPQLEEIQANPAEEIQPAVPSVIGTTDLAKIQHVDAAPQQNAECVDTEEDIFLHAPIFVKRQSRKRNNAKKIMNSEELEIKTEPMSPSETPAPSPGSGVNVRRGRGRLAKLIKTEEVKTEPIDADEHLYGAPDTKPISTRRQEPSKNPGVPCVLTAPPFFTPVFRPAGFLNTASEDYCQGSARPELVQFCTDPVHPKFALMLPFAAKTYIRYYVSKPRQVNGPSLPPDVAVLIPKGASKDCRKWTVEHTIQWAATFFVGNGAVEAMHTLREHNFCGEDVYKLRKLKSRTKYRKNLNLNYNIWDLLVLRARQLEQL